MRIIYKNDDWMYSREELEYMHFDENLRSNSESKILLTTYLDTDFGDCDFFKGGVNVPQSS